MVLLKFGKKIYLDEMVNKGKIRFTKIEFYKNNKCLSKGQKDKNENIDSRVQIENINIDGRDFSVVPGTISSLNYGGERYITYVFCMSHITKENHPEGKGFDERLWNDFGEYMVVIPEPQRFVDKISDACNQRGFLLSNTSGVMEYFSETSYVGDVGPLRKVDTYQYQNEYRLILHTLEQPGRGAKYFEYKDYIDIELGCLSGIVFGPIYKKNCPNTIVEGVLYLEPPSRRDHQSQI